MMKKEGVEMTRLVGLPRGKTENVVYRPQTKRFKRQTWDASWKIGRQNFDSAHQGYIVGMCRVLREGKN